MNGYEPPSESDVNVPEAVSGKSGYQPITEKSEELPENCRKYIEFIEEEIGYPITMISNGPGRNDIIYRNVD